MSENPGSVASATSTTSTVVYVGVYTGEGSEGVYRFNLDRAGGKLVPGGLAAPISNPSFLAVSPDKKFLYCCNEVSDFAGKKSGAATSFAIIGDSGELRQLDQAPSGGVGPCYVSVTPDGRAVLLANYGSGSAALLPVNPASGDLQEPSSVGQHVGRSVVSKRQDAPHTHSAVADPDNRFVFAADLGVDKIFAYRLQDNSHKMDTSAPVVTRTEPGAGPRHIAFHPSKKWVYVSNELNNTVSTWNWPDETGLLVSIDAVSTLPSDFHGKSSVAEVLVHPSGKFVYVSNRGHNSVAVFTVDQESGKLTAAGHVPTRGDHPRGMAVSPEGDFLLVANQNSHSLVTYRIDKTTGMPEFSHEFEGINRPTAFAFLVP